MSAIPQASSSVLIVLGHYGHMGGAERQAFHLIEWLRSRDLPVATLGWMGDQGPLADQARDLGCEVFSFPYRQPVSRLAYGTVLARLARFIRRRIAPEVILPYVSIHSQPVCLVWRHTGARYCWWNQQDEGRRLHGSRVERRALLNASHITSNSEVGADFIARTYRIPREQIQTYHNGTPVPDQASLQPKWREHLGVAPDTPIVSMLANVSPFKDHETLFRAWTQVHRNLSGARPANRPVLVLAGSTEHAPEHVAKLKCLAFDSGLDASAIRFLGAIRSTNELLYESDLVVHSSLTEGCPNAVCEAMALGKPVVGTDIPGMREALGHGHEDFLSPPGNEGELASKILKLIENPEMRTRIGLRNKHRIESEFAVDQMCEFLYGLSRSSPSSG